MPSPFGVPVTGRSCTRRSAGERLFHRTGQHRASLLKRRMLNSSAGITRMNRNVALAELEPREHPQGGGLAAPGGSDEHHDLAVADRELKVADGTRAVRVDLAHLVEDHVSHGLVICPRRPVIALRRSVGELFNESATPRRAPSRGRLGDRRRTPPSAPRRDRRRRSRTRTARESLPRRSRPNPSSP